jgi:Pyruvate/2-oxoacid:ferredoxin oxidoreductase gamma subunit
MGKRSEIHHKNDNKLDNRKKNLVFVTATQNIAARGKHQGNYTSQYKGVHFDKRTGKWVAQIRIDGHKKWLGRFDHEAQAAEAYNAAALECHGEFANLNIIRKEDGWKQVLRGSRS